MQKNIRNLEDKIPEISQLKQQKIILFNEDRLRELWDDINHINIHIIGVSKGKRMREKGA